MNDIDTDLKEAPSEGCGCTGDTKRAGQDPAYRKALWIVVILNIGFGLVELVGGFLANSQALKADSLDFFSATDRSRSSDCWPWPGPRARGRRSR